jgi:DNA-binding MarR family transcriptional regulator
MTNTLTIPVEAKPFTIAADADAHMTCRQMAILALVAEHPGQSNRPIATTLNISAPVVTRAADWLVGLGLITRVQDEEDRRRVRLTITAAGLRLLNSIRAAQG